MVILESEGAKAATLTIEQLYWEQLLARIKKKRNADKTQSRSKV